jgi:hypothetical protein
MPDNLDDIAAFSLTPPGQSGRMRKGAQLIR